MKYSLLLLLFLFLQPTPDPQLTARWGGPGAATVEWHQTARGCLSVIHATGERVFISCYEQPGSYRVELGHQGPLSGDLRPAAGDIYLVQTSGHTYRARLVWVRWLAVWRA